MKTGSAGEEAASIYKKRDHRDLPAMVPIIPLPSAQNQSGASFATSGLPAMHSLPLFLPSFHSFLPESFPEHVPFADCIS